MPDVVQPPPPRVRQTLENSCWAAVLDSWSRAAHWPTRLEQAALIAQWGEGPTGGITPEVKIPAIASAYGLNMPTTRFRWVGNYLREHLAASYIFCVYFDPLTNYMHTVLVFRMGDRDVHAMDPNGGFYRSWTLDSFVAYPSFNILHKP